MRVPNSWLRSYCDPPLSVAELGDLLKGSGTDLERIEQVGVPSAERFVVARVLSAEPHPNADRLRVCEVDDASADPRTIVCGAPNVAAGQTVAVALPGAVLPGGDRLDAVVLRGVESNGMILSETELGLGADSGGIMVLDAGLAPGTPLADVLAIEDDVFDFDVSPNRPDCLGVYGIAREVHALTGASLATDPTADDPDATGPGAAADYASVEIEDPEICLRFTARVFLDVEVGPSPLWLKARLAAAGQRPISNVVDITNYVMLTTGQPLHAFDLDKVRDSRVIVRRARPGERLTTLDGAERTLDPEVAVVADGEGPSGIAGIMGGQVSEVSASTTRVLMEAATWVGPNIMRSSERLVLRTEASGRFEKQLHPDSAIAAQRLAARLMVELCGAQLVPDTLDDYPSPLSPRRVGLRPARITKLLGTAIGEDEIGDTLGRLGFGVEPGDGELNVTVPSFRDGDVQREADLVEEVARVHGLDRLPATLPARRRAFGRLSGAQRLRRRLEDELRGRGLDEVISYSFIAPDTLRRLRLEATPLELANPLSADQSVMRPLLLPGLLDVARRNAARGRPALALFESAHVYQPPIRSDGIDSTHSPHGARPVRERHHLAAVLTSGSPGGWRSPPRQADFYLAKALVETVCAVGGVEWSVERGDLPFLHPGRQAFASAGGERIGWLGELHPTVAGEWDLERVAVFELDADALAALAAGPARYEQVPGFPALVQDIAVVVADDVPAADVERAVRVGGGPLLAEISIFDVYRGEQAGAGNKSLALRLAFRSSERTLTDEDVAAARAEIERALIEIGGRLRD